MRAALVQMDVVLGDREGNLHRAQEGLQEAANLGAQLAILPELWGTGYNTENWSQEADLMGEGLFSAASAFAQQYDVTLIAGSLLEKDASGRLFNTCTVWSSQGKQLGCYRKRYLFGLMEEDKFLSPGNSLSKLTIPAPLQPEEEFELGLAICYDLRFPEHFRELALMGCEVFIIPAQWPHPRGNHWNRLLQARAIENLAYVLGVNRVGGGETTQFCGRSVAIDPWGEILIEAGEEKPQILIADIDPRRVRESRKTLPVLEDARRMRQHL